MTKFAVAFHDGETAERITSLLRECGYEVIRTCSSADEVKRTFRMIQDGILIAGVRLRNRSLDEIAADLNDFSWFDRIDAQNGVCFIAAGVFYYFRTDDIKKLFLAMAKHFPGGKLVFDSANKRAVKIMLKTWVKEAGITSIDEYFSVENIDKDIIPWMKNAKVSARGYMLGYNDLRDPSVPKMFRLMAKLGDGFMKMQIIRIDFTE